MEFDKKIFAANLKHAREKKHWTPKQVAKLSGVSYDSICDYERELVSSPGAAAICSLCKVLDVTPNQLFGWKEVA